MSTDTYLYRVFFTDGTSREVTARDAEGAKRCALSAEQMIRSGHRTVCKNLGRPAPKYGKLVVSSVKQLWPVGYHAQPELFNRTEAQP